jgi:hypothetical protein
MKRLVPIGDRPRLRDAGNRRVKDVRGQSTFVLEINRTPVLAFDATSDRAARARVREPWFIEELARMRSNGKPILSPNDQCRVRAALPTEMAAVSLQRGLDGARGEDTKYAFAFLIPVDPEPN